MYEYEAIVKAVKDGDTIDVIIDLGFRIGIEQRVRLLGVDTPEIHGKVSDEELLAGTNAKKYVENCILNKRIRVVTKSDKQEKFGRYLADVYFKDEKAVERWLNKELVDKGYAKPYFGEKKEPFKTN